MNNEYMLKQKPWKSILKFALPLMAANTLQQLYNTVDTLVVGNFDSQSSLAAVGSCSYLVMLFLALAIGLSTGSGILISQSYGANDTNKMKRVSGTSITFLTMLGLLMSIVTWFIGPYILKYVIKVPNSIYSLSVLYLRSYAIGLVFQYGYNAIAASLKALGDSQSSLYFLLITSICNIVLDLVFVIVFNWSVIGVGLATTISQCISMIIAYIYMAKKYPMFKYEKNIYHNDKSIIKSIIDLGVPMAFAQMVSSLGFMLLQRVVNSYGEMMAASYTVACRLEIYMLVPNIAISQAIATYTGQNYGAKKFNRIKQGIMQSNFILIAIDLIIGILVFMFTYQLIGLFNLNGLSIIYCATHLRIVAADFILNGLRGTVLGAFQGVGKSKLSMYCSATEIICRVIFAYALSSVLGPGAVWWPEVIAFAVSMIMAYVMYYSNYWQKDLILK